MTCPRPRFIDIYLRIPVMLAVDVYALRSYGVYTPLRM